ncbi:MAG TPA: MarR family transcriptional regulator [Caulobacteraceae bacterium]|nr:MarR family transcriptional regulator [Caulobacteraceae bacterium]
MAAVALYREARLDGALRPLGVTMSRFRVMSALMRCGASTMSELANFTSVDRTTLTRIADQLVDAAYAERLPEPKDRRRVVLDLTAAGRRLYRQAALVIREQNEAISEGVPEDEMRGLARVLVKVMHNATDNEATRSALIHYRRDLP